MTKKTVVALLVTNLAVSVIVALTTLLLHGPILAYQHEHHPSADLAALSRTLWTRPLPILLVAALYIRFVRQLLRGDPRALRRVRIVSAAGLLGVAWLLLSAEYPVWLRIAEGVQLLLLAALVITVNLRTVRSAFDAPVPADTRPRNRKAAWTLILLAPVIAELMLGNIPVGQLWAFPIFIPIYGAGSLLIREVTRRTGRGLPTMLLLGLAYGLVEEGLVLQSLTSPTIYHAAQWAPRLLGVNTAYTELNLIYHPVFSITIPIVLTELLFAGHGHRPYLRRGGLIIAGTVATLGALLVHFTVLPSEDPNYTMPPLTAAAILTVTLLVTVTAFAVRRKPAHPAATAPHAPAHPTAPASHAPTHPTAPASHAPAPTTTAADRPASPATATPARVLSPAATAVVTAVAAFAFVALLFPFAGAEQSFFTHGAWAFAPMTAAAVITLVAGLLLRRWTAAASWTPAHLFAAALGATAGHAVFGLIANAGTWPDRAFLGALILLTVTLGATALRRLTAAARRPEGESAHVDATR
ncbi:hypothetical protein [Actinoplanes sp. L3-i22]|uniref:hypothetical protein n=1 Tax=Actinoplanes sp. L3-i22 TaxID=2836373 RepID=UPI001C7520C1|nr:hypothetical protein [Actinoplanes sp. L3-i22]BCY07653.1 hypothetical protein L3i22_027410 [Actinoplanes sp. L3-i22]